MTRLRHQQSTESSAKPATNKKRVESNEERLGQRHNERETQRVRERSEGVSKSEHAARLSLLAAGMYICMDMCVCVYMYAYMSAPCER